ncbi:hypothetical protein [Deinococcus petrolearius]|uniref:Uncharacterized protein n=1 Tax=Deinococcus petrolearius TaxID=1751295 RepID=A0ABW1DL64_9DEIO
MPPLPGRAPENLAHVHFPFAYELARVLVTEDNAPEWIQGLRDGSVVVPEHREVPSTYREHRRLLVTDLLMSVRQSPTPTWEVVRQLATCPVTELHHFLADLSAPFDGWTGDLDGLPPPAILGRVQREMQALFLDQAPAISA